MSHGARAHDGLGTIPGRTDELETYEFIVAGETRQTVQRFHNGQGVGEIKKVLVKRELAKRDALQ